MAAAPGWTVEEVNDLNAWLFENHPEVQFVVNAWTDGYATSVAPVFAEGAGEVDLGMIFAEYNAVQHDEPAEPETPPEEPPQDNPSEGDGE